MNKLEKILDWIYDAENESTKARKEFDKYGAREMGSVEFGKECAYNDCRRKIIEIWGLQKNHQ